MSSISIHMIYFIIPLSNSVLFFWVLLTLASILTVTILYRYLAGKDIEAKNHVDRSNDNKAKTRFISASVENAKSIIRLANEDVPLGYLT